MTKGKIHGNTTKGVMKMGTIKKWIFLAQIWICIANGGGFDGDMFGWIRNLGGASGTG